MTKSRPSKGHQLRPQTTNEWRTVKIKDKLIVSIPLTNRISLVFAYNFEELQSRALEIVNMSGTTETAKKSFAILEVLPSDAVVMDRIGVFRYDLWCKETEVNHDLFPEKKWIEEIDYTARHWVAFEGDSPESIDVHTAPILGVARLTVHNALAENPDGYIWIRHGLEDRCPVPVADLCKLSVSASARGLGIGRSLSEIRINAARDMGAKSVLVTASEKNARILEKLGFQDTGIREVFPNRPTYEFLAMDLKL